MHRRKNINSHLHNLTKFYLIFSIFKSLKINILLEKLLASTSNQLLGDLYPTRKYENNLDQHKTKSKWLSDLSPTRTVKKTSECSYWNA